MESFIESYPFKWKLEADRLEIKIRLSIFTIISVCAGLPALVWSVRDLIHHRKNGHHISVYTILLLLTDFVEIFLSPYILIKDLLDGYLGWTFRVLWSLRGMSRDCGILLHQLVALDGILSVKYPLYTAASVYPSPCFIIFYTLMFICTFFGHFFLPDVYLTIAAVVFIMSVITCISLTCGAVCSADRHSHTSMKPDHHIVVVFIFTLLVLYLPYILVRLFLDHHPLLHIPSFLMSMRLISDPLLCVLVCRQNFRIQTSLNPEATSLVT